MFSKILRFSAGLTAAALLASCSLPVNDEPPKSVAPSTNIGFQSACLADVLPVMRGFINGSAKDVEVRGVWNCFGSAIDLFYKKVKGNNKDSYSPRELAQFFEDYFLQKVRLNDELLTEIMHIKQIMVGGRADQLTKEELRKLMDFAVEARDLSVRILPYMKVFSMSWKEGDRTRLKEDMEYFDKANLEVQAVAKQLGDRIASNHQDYDIGNLVRLLDQLEKLYGEHWEFVDQLRSGLPLVNKLKKSLVGGDQATIGAPEWRRFSLLAARGYVQYLRYYYFIQNAPDESHGHDFLFIAKSIDDLFSFLGDMVQEKPERRFTKVELIEILDSVRAIWPRLDISPVLVDEAMKIKRVFFGGSSDEFVPEEFEKARGKVDTFRNISENVFGYLNLYSGAWKPEDMPEDQARAYFQAGVANLDEMAVKLSSIMETQYDLRDLQRFAHELTRLFPPADPDKGVDLGKFADRYVPLAITAKNILANDSGPVVSASQWSMLLKTCGEFYGRYMYYDYFVSPQPALLRGPGLNALSDLVHQVLGSIDGLLARRGPSPARPGIVRFSELDRLIDGLAAADLLPDLLEVDLLKPTLRIVLQKFLLRPEERLAGHIPSGLGPEATLVLKKEFDAWVEGQVFIQNVFYSAPAAGLSGPQIVKVIDGLAFTETLNEFKMSLRSPMPLTFDPQGRLFISRQRPIQYQPSSLMRLNLARLIARLVINSYASDLTRIQKYTGFTKAEANQLFTDLKPIAVKLGLIESDNTTFADNRFREANLFAPHADGNEIVSFREGVDLTLLILSGLKLDTAMKAQLQRQCQVISGARDKDLGVSLSCFLSVYRKEMPTLFNSMPEFTSYASKLGRDSFNEMLTNYLKAAGWVDDKRGFVKFADAALVPHVIQYAEATMAKFDSDRDSSLDRVESMDAYPVFKALLAKVTGMSSEKILKGGFAYILVKGKVPETLLEKIEFMTIWVNQSNSWPIHVDRKRVGDVLGYIAEQVAKGEKPSFGAETVAAFCKTSTSADCAEVAHP